MKLKMKRVEVPDWPACGRNLKRARVLAGISQARLAEMIGVKEMWVSGFECGRKQTRYPRQKSGMSVR